MKSMIRFNGIEVKPYSTVTDMPRVRIDRVRVEVTKTLFNEIEYSVMGTLGPDGQSWPICPPSDDVNAALDSKCRLEAAIEAARRKEAPLNGM